MKYRQENGYYLPISRKLFNDKKFKQKSINARWLYAVLCELEHKYTGENEDFFFRSDKDLAEDAGMSTATVWRTKKELKNVVEMWQMHWVNPDTEKKSKKHVTAYRLKE